MCRRSWNGPSRGSLHPVCRSPFWDVLEAVTWMRAFAFLTAEQTAQRMSFDLEPMSRVENTGPPGDGYCGRVFQ